MGLRVRSGSGSKRVTPKHDDDYMMVKMIDDMMMMMMMMMMLNMMMVMVMMIIWLQIKAVGDLPEQGEPAMV